MLGSRRARAYAISFVLSRFVTIGISADGVALLAGSADNDSGGLSESTGWFTIVLGVLLLVVALRHRQGRPRDGSAPATPKRMAASRR